MVARHLRPGGHGVAELPTRLPRLSVAQPGVAERAGRFRVGGIEGLRGFPLRDGRLRVVPPPEMVACRLTNGRLARVVGGESAEEFIQPAVGIGRLGGAGRGQKLDGGVGKAQGVEFVLPIRREGVGPRCGHVPQQGRRDGQPGGKLPPDGGLTGKNGGAIHGPAKELPLAGTL